MSFTISSKVGFLGTLLCFMFCQNMNLSRTKVIADQYAENARGAVTSVGRNFFAVGQAIAPIVSGVLYTVDVLLPYAALSLVSLGVAVLFLLTRTPLFHDPPAEPAPRACPAPSVTTEASAPPAGGAATLQQSV